MATQIIYNSLSSLLYPHYFLPCYLLLSTSLRYIYVTMRSTAITLILLSSALSSSNAFLHSQHHQYRYYGCSSNNNNRNPDLVVVLSAEPNNTKKKNNIPPRRVSTNDDPAFLSQDSNGFTGTPSLFATWTITCHTWTLYFGVVGSHFVVVGISQSMRMMILTPAITTICFVIRNTYSQAKITGRGGESISKAPFAFSGWKCRQRISRIVL
jgi:hypothetical protein